MMNVWFVYCLLIASCAFVGQAGAFLLPFRGTVTNLHRRLPPSVAPALDKLRSTSRLRTVRYYTPQFPGTSVEEIRRSFAAEVKAQPSKKVIQLEYNFLSPSSIFTIRHKWQPAHTLSARAIARGMVKESRPGDSFLINWWRMAKKWNVLSDHLLKLNVTESDRLATAASIAMTSSRTDFDIGISTQIAADAASPAASTPTPAVKISTFDQDLLYLKEVLERPNLGAMGYHTERRMNESMARLLRKHQDALKVRLGEKIFKKYDQMYGKYGRDCANSTNSTNNSISSTSTSNGTSSSTNINTNTNITSTSTKRTTKPSGPVAPLTPREIQSKRDREKAQLSQRVTDFIKALRTAGHETARLRFETLHRVLFLACGGGEEKKVVPRGAGEVEEGVPLEALHRLCRGHSARVIAVGDVHGCVEEVRILLRKVSFTPGDQIVFLGDLVIKGPESPKVVRLAMDLGALAVRGNHDHEAVRDFFSSVRPLTDAFASFEEAEKKAANQPQPQKKPHGAKLDQINQSAVGISAQANEKNQPEKENTPPAPQTTTKDSSDASEASQAPLAPQDQAPPWPQVPLPPGMDRIVASLPPSLATRPHTVLAATLSPEELAWLHEMPYIIQSGDLRSVFVHAELQPNVTFVDQQPQVNMYMTMNKKWAKFWRGPLTAYFGHDTARGLQQHPYAYGLDTGCVYGGLLTAVLLPKKEIVQVNSVKRKRHD